MADKGPGAALGKKVASKSGQSAARRSSSSASASLVWLRPIDQLARQDGVLGQQRASHGPVAQAGGKGGKAFLGRVAGKLALQACDMHLQHERAFDHGGKLAGQGRQQGLVDEFRSERLWPAAVQQWRQACPRAIRRPQQHGLDEQQEAANALDCAVVVQRIQQIGQIIEPGRLRVPLHEFGCALGKQRREVARASPTGGKIGCIGCVVQKRGLFAPACKPLRYAIGGGRRLRRHGQTFGQAQSIPPGGEFCRAGCM